jgi:hypothetical protein
MATGRKKTPPLRLHEMRDRWFAAREKLEGQGTLLHVFFLPLALCKRQNAKFGAAGWQASKDRKETLGYLRMQSCQRPEPLPGRPYVRCVRFSSEEPDKYCDWAKVAVDCLCSMTTRSPHRLGIIFDDAPKFAEIDQQWRKAKAGEGFCVIEVWAGAEVVQAEIVKPKRARTRKAEA